MIATIDKAGRLVVPKKIREQFNMVPGMELEIEAEAEGVRLRVPGGGSALTIKRGILVHHGSAKVNLDIAEFIREERDSRGRRLVSGGRGR